VFLSRRSNGIYYLWFEDELGRRQKITTRTRLKSEAFVFLRRFKQESHKRTVRQRNLLLSEFVATFVVHSAAIHTPKTLESNETALKQFQKILGDLPLEKIGVREVETFLARKKSEASEWTARKYYLALAAAFETAKRWGHIASNPFRQVEKPRVPELLPQFFSREDF
jgi:site-specific recombinase XerD